MNQSNRRRTEITIETHSLTIIRMRGGELTNSAYCRNCEKSVAFFRFTHAALIFQAALTELERLSQNKQIHFADNGELCGCSLAAFFGREIRCVED